MTVATGPGWEIRLGDWRERLADVEACDVVSGVMPTRVLEVARKHGLGAALEHNPQMRDVDEVTT